MKRKRKNIMMKVLFSAFFALSIPGYAVDRCGGINSDKCSCNVANPFDCANGGNCT